MRRAHTDRRTHTPDRVSLSLSYLDHVGGRGEGEGPDGPGGGGHDVLHQRGVRVALQLEHLSFIRVCVP